jgi:hypothetical protein
MWQGLGHVINSFRKNMLGLEVLTSSQGAGVLDMLKVPWTYCWSKSLLPKPKDWKEHIGEYSLEQGRRLALEILQISPGSISSKMEDPIRRQMI